MSDLYRWSNQGNGAWVDTEEMRKELVEDGVLVPVTIDYEAAIGKYFKRFGASTDERTDIEADIKAVVDAAVKGDNDE